MVEDDDDDFDKTKAKRMADRFMSVVVSTTTEGKS
jgi:hypothetical protein